MLSGLETGEFEPLTRLYSANMPFFRENPSLGDEKSMEDARSM
jgi:hypothetical protein